MAKTALNVKNNRSTFQSVRDVPFSAAEIKELEQIQEKDYWARKPLKEAFCDKNNRMITEVNQYFKDHKKPPLNYRKAGSERTTESAPSNTPAPKEQVVNTTGEIKVTFKTMRVEGNIITFEL